VYVYYLEGFLSIYFKCPASTSRALASHLFSRASCTLRRHGPCPSKMPRSFQMKCHHQILSIRWQDHVRNIEVTNQTLLPPVMEHVVCLCLNSIFGHIARMSHTVPAHQTPYYQVELSLVRLLDSSRKRHPGRPNKR